MTSQRIIRPDTAFSVVRTKQKRPRIEDKAHLAFIRTLRCCICGAPNPDPAHIRTASPVHGKRETGGAEKASDKWTVPLCRTHHDEQHAAGTELSWWASKGIDPFGLALALHSASGDEEIAEGILRSNMKVGSPVFAERER
jgi:hypothetical protein